MQCHEPREFYRGLGQVDSLGGATLSVGIVDWDVAGKAAIAPTKIAVHDHVLVVQLGRFDYQVLG